MKKFIALLIAICLAFAIFTGCNGTSASDGTSVEDTVPAESSAPSEEPAAEADEQPAAEIHSVDLEALYASHEPDEVVASVDGSDITWEEYYYFLSVQVQQIDNYFAQMASYYGETVNWDDEIDTDATYEDIAVTNAESMLSQLIGIEKYAADNGVKLGSDDDEQLASQLQSDIATVCGDDATEEQFDEAISGMHLTRELYDRMNRVNLLYSKGFKEKYGEDGELVSDKDAIKYLEDNGYLSAGHILLMTIDPATGDALSDDEIAEKKATADKLAEELKAIKDPEELNKRFAELKEQYCEDTGKETYPDGYVFTEGTMVTEFEDTVKALEDNEVSEPVLSRYGYHIIIRLPLDADRTVSYTSDGSPVSARYLYASDKYTKDVQAVIDSMEVKHADGFDRVDIAGYVK